MVLSLRLGQIIDRQKILHKLVEIQYTRNDIDFKRGTFRVRGDVIEVIPAAYGEKAVRIEMFDDEVDRIVEFDVLTGDNNRNMKQNIPPHSPGRTPSAHSPAAPPASYYAQSPKSACAPY